MTFTHLDSVWSLPSSQIPPLSTLDILLAQTPDYPTADVAVFAKYIFAPKIFLHKGNEIFLIFRQMPKLELICQQILFHAPPGL